MKRTILVAAAVLLASPASAHHSGAMFDQGKLIELSGTLLEYKFQAPHSWLSIITADKQRWDIEGSSSGQMRRLGLTPAEIKPGLKMTIKIHPMRDGRKAGSLVSMTANGKTYGSDYTKNGYGKTANDGGAQVKDR